MAASTATGVFAADNISGSTDQQQSRPAQEMMQGQQADKGQMPQMNGKAEKQLAPPEMNDENKPADLPEISDENKPADLPEMKNGERPEGPKEVGDVLSEIGKSGDTSDDSIQSLLKDYSNAVDSERNATDSDAKTTAANLVKGLVDTINSLLEKLGFSARINTPADKPDTAVPGVSEASF